MVFDSPKKKLLKKRNVLLKNNNLAKNRIYAYITLNRF